MMMMNQCHSPSSSSSLKHRIKSSMCGGFSCFGADDADSYQQALDEKHHRASTRSSPRAWLKSTAQELPEIRDLCRGFIARMGKHRRNANGLADLGYDPMSYALNFEDDRSREDDDFPFRSFSSRLPASPERKFPVKCPVVDSRGPVACI